MTITIRSRAGAPLLSAFGGVRVRVNGARLPAPEVEATIASVLADGGTVDMLQVAITAPVEGAIAYQLLAAGGRHATIPASADPLVLEVPLQAASSPIRRRATVRAIGADGPGFAARVAVTQAPDEVEEPAEPILITAAPSITFNGGYVVGAQVSAAPPGFTGGPLTAPMGVQYLITDPEGMIAYDGGDGAHAGKTFTELLITMPTEAPEAWLGERFAVRYTLTADAGTVVVWTALSDEITAGEPLPRPEALGPDDWGVTARPADAPNEGTHHVRQYQILKAGLTPYAVEWLNAAIQNFPDPESYEGFWNPCLQREDGLWDHRTLDGSADREFVNGTSATNLRIRYKMSETGPWSPASTDNKRVTYQAPPPPSPNLGWHHSTFIEPEERAAGETIGGGGEQHWHCVVRSKSDPSLIIAAQDVGGTWYSEDDGKTWAHSLDRGLRCYFMAGLANDPDDREVWLAVGGDGFKTAAQPYNGIYRSTDRGRSWTLRENFSARGERLSFRRGAPLAFAYDETSPATPNTRTVYAVVTLRTGAMGTNGNAQLWRSNDGGQTWNKVRDLLSSTFGGINTLVHHPSQAGRLMLGTDRGFWELTNYGVTATKRNINGAGNYPIVSIEPNPDDGDEIYTCITSVGSTIGTSGVVGVYRSTNGPAGTWSRVSTPSGFPCSQIAVGAQNGGGWGPVNQRTLYLIGRSPGDHRMRVSHDGGGSWFTPICNRRPGKAGDSGSISDQNSGGSANGFRTTRVLPHPTNRAVCFIHTRAKCYRSEDRGQTFFPSQRGFEGQQFGVGSCGLAFSKGTGPDDYLRIFVGVTDTGGHFTDDGGMTWEHLRPRQKHPIDGSNLWNSVNAVALSPANSDERIFTVGHTTLTDTFLYRSRVRSPGSGDLTCINAQRSPSNPIFLEWHATKPGRVYYQAYRFANAGQAGLPTIQNYGSGGGTAIALWPGNNDYVMARDGTILRWSQDEGSTWSLYVNVGHNPVVEDNRYPVIAWHPTNHQIIFTISAGKDLARYNRATNTWKSNYNLIARVRSDYPEIAGADVRLKSIAIDPQDPNVGLVSFESPSYSTVYRSVDFQSDNPSWEDVSFNLPSLSGANLYFHPTNGECVAGFNAIGGLNWLQKPEGAIRPSPSIAQMFRVP